MNPLVMTLIFSLVMLMFMAYPAMKITTWLIENQNLPKKHQNILTITITILLSLAIGIFLQLT